MFKKAIIITGLFILLFLFSYESATIHISSFLTRSHYAEYPLLSDSSTVESKSYRIRKISSREGYSGGLSNILSYDDDRKAYFLTFLDDSTQVVISDNGAIAEFKKDEINEIASGIDLTIYPEKYYAFEHSWKSKGEPVTIINYHKIKFEWPSACPYVGIPICNGWMWSGNAFFEVEHNGEKLKFHLDTQYHLFDGYDGQVYKLSLPESTNSRMALLNINSSSNEVSRSSGWYAIIPHN